MQFWVATMNGEICGCIGVCDGPAYKRAAAHEGAKKVASVWRLTVDENVRFRGIGRELMNTAEAYLKKAGYDEISLLSGNEMSKNFYDKIGYHRESVAWHLGNHESIYFKKLLA